MFFVFKHFVAGQLALSDKIEIVALVTLLDDKVSLIELYRLQSIYDSLLVKCVDAIEREIVHESHQLPLLILSLGERRLLEEFVLVNLGGDAHPARLTVFYEVFIEVLYQYVVLGVI